MAHPETALQISIKAWLAVVAPDVVAHHSPNGELRDKRTGAKLKAMGVMPGWPDLTLLDASGRVHFLEIKAGKGALSPAQSEFRQTCMRRGINWACVRSIDDVQAALDYWQIPTRSVKP